MTKAELIDAIADRAGITKVAAVQALDAMAEATEDALRQGNDVTLTGIGKLVAKTSTPRTGRNLQTGEAIEIPAKTAAKFKQSKALGDALNA